VIGIPADAQGPLPDALVRARDAGAGTFVLQPGGPFSDRSVLSAARLSELAAVLEGSDIFVVEDDSLGPLSPVPTRSLGALRPDHTIRVLSYCKAYGLDLRTSVLGGARRLIDRAIRARSGGIASNSRILQNALGFLLQDAAAAAVVTEARTRYAVRRGLALAAFADAGLVARSGPGSLVVWVEVPSERAASIALATRGIVVEGSSSTFVSTPQPEMLRVSVAQLPEDPALAAELADTFARAVGGDLRVHFD
jgi:DNA-binding transcriptional MocR family regulator